MKRWAWIALLCIACEPTEEDPTVPGFDCKTGQAAESEARTAAAEDPDAVGQWFVVYEPGPRAASRDAELRQRFDDVQPRSVGFTATMTAREAAEIEAEDGVLRVERDADDRLSIPTPVEDGGGLGVLDVGPEAIAFGIDRADQRTLPLDGSYNAFATGAGVHLFVIDTGFSNHPEWDGRLGESFTAPGLAGPFHEHGAHVAGTAAGSTFGIAPAAILHSVRVLSSSGSGSISQVVAGVDWVADRCAENDWPCVSNMSLGGDASVAIDLAVCRAIEMGVHFALAAGNDESDACGDSPARVWQAMTVGATDRGDRAASFSNFGRCVNGHAVGVSVASVGGSMSGTSMASPHVAGALALCLEAGAEDPRACVEERYTEGVLSGLRGETVNELLFVGTD